jgi:non-homologous end joining protein Ku
MASTIRSMTLNVATLSVPVALKCASERKLPGFSTASPWGNKYERFIGNGEPEERLVETAEDAEAIADALGTTVAPAQARYLDKVTGEVFEEDEIKRGVWENETFYAIDPDEIKQIDELVQERDLNIQTFVPVAEVPWERVKHTYFLTPQGSDAGLRALNLLKVAMQETGTAAVTLLMPKSRVALALIYPRYGGMLISTLAYAEEWAQVKRGSAELSDPRGEPKPEELAMAVKLVETLSTGSGEFLDGIKDVQADLKVELIERAKAGRPLTDQTEAAVADGEHEETLLEATLRESLAALQPKRKRATPKSKTSATSAATSSSRKKRRVPAKA